MARGLSLLTVTYIEFMARSGDPSTALLSGESLAVIGDVRIEKFGEFHCSGVAADRNAAVGTCSSKMKKGSDNERCH